MLEDFLFLFLYNLWQILHFAAQKYSAFKKSMGLSTRALKMDSLDIDPRSEFNVARLSSTRHADYAHCTAHALSQSTPRAARPDWGCMEAKWSLNNPDP